MSETNQTRLLYRLESACLTLDALTDDLGLDRHAITMAARSLIAKGYVERAEAGCFRLTEAGIEARVHGVVITSGPNGPLAAARKPLPDTLRQRAWTVMRIRRKFAIPDLMIAATTGEEKLAHNNLQRYCRALCNARVLRQLPTKQPGDAMSSPGYNRFMLVKDLGMVAPTYRQPRKALFDHNSGEELACA